MGICSYIPKRRASAYLLLFLCISTILLLSSHLTDDSISVHHGPTKKHNIHKFVDRDLDDEVMSVRRRTSRRQGKAHQKRTQQLEAQKLDIQQLETQLMPEKPALQNPTSKQLKDQRKRPNNDYKHYLYGFMSGGYINFYNAKLGERLSFSFYSNDLQNKSLSLEKETCKFLVENSERRIEVARGYDCLLQIEMKDAKSELDIFRAIKYGSLSLDTFYTQPAAINLMKTIISGYENEVSILGISADNITQFCTGYRNDEEKFLEKMFKLNISDLNQRVMVRQSFLHLYGRSSFNENATQINFESAIETLNYVRNSTKIEQKNVLDVVLTMTEDYAIAAATCMISALVNSDLETFYRFRVVMDPEREISEESRKKLASYTYIRNYSIDYTAFSFDLVSDIVKQNVRDKDKRFITMYRLYVDKIFPDLDSALYLDTDIIVRADLYALKTIDMRDYIWAGVPKVGYGYKQPYCNSQLPHHFINAGVLFLNLTNSRRVSIHDKIVDYLLYINECSKHEQSLINTVFSDYIYFLPHRWNAITNPKTERFHFSSFIIHHIGGGKPWKRTNALDLENKFDELPAYRQEWGRYQRLARW